MAMTTQVTFQGNCRLFTYRVDAPNRTKAILAAVDHARYELGWWNTARLHNITPVYDVLGDEEGQSWTVEITVDHVGTIPPEVTP